MRFAAPRDAAASGITALPQEVIAAPHLSVGRNVLLGFEGPRASVDKLTESEAMSVRWALSEVGATFSPTIRAEELNTSDLWLVQIARTMLHVGDIVVMDEPTAVLSEPEAENLLRHLVSFRANGKAIVYVIYRLSEVMQIADRATILRDGRVVGTLKRILLIGEKCRAYGEGPSRTERADCSHGRCRKLPGARDICV